MTLPAVAPAFPGRTGMMRTAVASDDYVEIYKRRMAADGSVPRLSRRDKQLRMQALLSDRVAGFERLGVGMIGPIQLKLRYQGMIRNVLIEDPITPGTPVEYEVFDDLGQAYIMSGTEGEVRVTPFEGKRVRVEFFRIASRPAIRKEDLYSMRVNMVEQAQDETKQAILKQEDSRLMVLLQAAVTDYATRPDNPTPGAQNVTVASGPLTPESLYAAVTMTDLREIESSRILLNPADYRDFFLFDQNKTGWAFKDRVVAGEKITTFGEFQIQRSIIVPQGKIFLLPDPDFLGVFPVLYSLDVEEDNRVESFWRGWVFDEMVSMAVLNPRGIATITKSTFTG
jgi:hypothetical protein